MYEWDVIYVHETIIFSMYLSALIVLVMTIILIMENLVSFNNIASILFIQ